MPIDLVSKSTGELINERRDVFAEGVVEQLFAHSSSQTASLIEDAKQCLVVLAQAIVAREPRLFHDYIDWGVVRLVSRGDSTADLARLLTATRDVLGSRMPAEMGGLAGDYVMSALKRLNSTPAEPPSFLEEGQLSTLARQYLNALLKGDRRGANELVQQAVADGTPIKEIYLDVFERTLYEVGRLWQVNRISVAKEHYCTAAIQLSMSQLYPHILNEKKCERTLVITGVSGDLHEIGARMVGDFFEMEGWRTYTLGTNTPSLDVVQTVIETKADVLGISATMTYHIKAVGELITAIRDTRECAQVKILVGGYCFKIAPTLWTTLGADGWAPDAGAAVVTANHLFASGG